MKIIHLCIVAISFLFTACSSPRSHPNIHEIYDQAARTEIRNPVIVVHGILGARLEEQATRKVVWGAFTKETVDFEAPRGARALALPFVDLQGRMLAESPKVVATGPVDALDVDLFFGVVSVDVYAQILQALGVAGSTKAPRRTTMLTTRVLLSSTIGAKTMLKMRSRLVNT